MYKDNNNERLDWDTPLPIELIKELDERAQELGVLPKIEINRHIFEHLPKTLNVESVASIQGFADGEKDAYGVDRYVRFPTKDSAYKSHLILNKSKMDPAKRLSTIPTHELNALVLNTKVGMYAADIPKIPKERIFLHTDSLIVVFWVQHAPGNLRRYISNRVKIIQYSKLQVLYTNTENNPADLVTKRHAASKINSQLWLEGPPYLKKDMVNWTQPNILRNKSYFHKPTIELGSEELKLANNEIKHITIIPCQTNVHNISCIPLTKEDKAIATKECRQCQINLIFTKTKNYPFISLLNSTNSFSKLLIITAYTFRCICRMTLNFTKERRMKLCQGFENINAKNNLEQKSHSTLIILHEIRQAKKCWIE